MKKISFDEFVRRVPATLDRVVHDSEVITIELDSGERDLLRVVDAGEKCSQARTEEDHATFLASVGGRSGVDIDAFLEQNDARR